MNPEMGIKTFFNLIEDISAIGPEARSIDNVLFSLRLRGLGKNTIVERKKIARLAGLFFWGTQILMSPLLFVTYFKSFVLSLFVSLIPYAVFDILSLTNVLFLVFLVWGGLNYKKVSISLGLFTFDLLEFITGGKLFELFMKFYNGLPLDKRQNFINEKNNFFITHLYTTKQVWGSFRENLWEGYFTSIAIKCADDPELLKIETERYWFETATPENLFTECNPPSLERLDAWRDDDEWKSMTYASLKINLKNNIDINKYDGISPKRTMLCIAVVNNTPLELVKMLTDAGADVNWPQIHWDDKEFSILKCAVSYSSAEVVKHLISCGANINAAAGNGFVPSGFVGPHNFFETAILSAKEPQILREIVTGPNQEFLMDKNDNTLMHYAAVSPKDRSEYIKVLLDLGFDIDAKNSTDRTPLIYGLSNNLFGPVDIFGEGSSNLDNMKFLLTSGANPNAYDESGDTALHWLSNSNFITGHENERVSELLLSGADIEALNNSGFTPLICAGFRGQHETINSLISHGANLEFVSNLNVTAFEAACKREIDETSIYYDIEYFVRTVDLFLEAGVDVHKHSSWLESKPLDFIFNRLSGRKEFSMDDLPNESILSEYLRDY